MDIYKLRFLPQSMRVCLTWCPQVSDPEQGLFGIGEHTDYGMIILLATVRRAKIRHALFSCFVLMNSPRFEMSRRHILERSAIPLDFTSSTTYVIYLSYRLSHAIGSVLHVLSCRMMYPGYKVLSMANGSTCPRGREH